jgi:hypothetical protein
VRDKRGTRQAAIDVFAAMGRSVEPTSKARLLCGVVDAACACVNEAYRRAGTVAGPEAMTINADDLVGLFSYIVIHSDTSPLAQVAFLEAFLDGEECIEMSGFLLTSLQVCAISRARARAAIFMCLLYLSAASFYAMGAARWLTRCTPPRVRAQAALEYLRDIEPETFSICAACLDASRSVTVHACGGAARLRRALRRGGAGWPSKVSPLQVYCTACNARLCDACDNKRHELSHDVDLRLHKRTRERPVTTG